MLGGQTEQHVTATAGTAADNARALPPGGYDLGIKAWIRHFFDMEIHRGNAVTAVAPGAYDVGIFINAVWHGSTLEALAQLKPAFKKPDGVIHAGNSSQISDGAAALLMTTSDKARELGMAPVARIAWKEATNVSDGTMTSSPGPMPRAARAK